MCLWCFRVIFFNLTTIACFPDSEFTTNCFTWLCILDGHRFRARFISTMLRNPINSDPRALSPRQVDQLEEDAVQEEQQPAASVTHLPVSDYPVPTPPEQHRAPSTSRKRSILRRDENLSAHKIATLSLANTLAAEEHKLKMKILRLQEEKEKEILDQERLKTRQEAIKLQILELELSKK